MKNNLNIIGNKSNSNDKKNKNHRRANDQGAPNLPSREPSAILSPISSHSYRTSVLP